MTNNITNNPALKRFLDAPYRKLELDPANPALLFPSICLTTPGGDILVLDDLGHAAFLYTPPGKLIRRIGGKGSAPGEFNHPAAAAFAPDGRILITDCWNHRVQIFSPELDFLSTFGSPGNASGQLLEPSGAAIFNGNIIIAERENRRLSIFEQNGNFICSLRNLSGLENPLSYITSIAVVGRYLAALMDTGTVLILDEHFICENIINLRITAGLPMALYAAGVDVFIVASYTGGLTYYALEGSVLRANNTVLSDSHQNGAPNNEAGGVYAVAADLGSKQFAIVAAPSFRSPLFKLLESAIAPVSGGHGVASLPFVSGICSCAPTISASDASEFNKAEPDKFRATLLTALLQSNGDNIESADETAINIIKRTPAVSAFHSIAKAAPDLHKSASEYSKNNCVEIIEQISFAAAASEGKQPFCYEMLADGVFAVYLHPGGLIRVDRHNMTILTPNEVDAIFFLSLACDGTFAACTIQNELVHLAPDGRLIRKLTAKVPQQKGVSRQCSKPRTRDGRAFVWPNFATGSLDTFDLFCSSPESPIDSFNLPSGVAIDVAFPANGHGKLVLTSENTILTLNETNNITATRVAPEIDLYTTMFICVASDGDILTSHFKLAGNNDLDGYPLITAKTNATDRNPLFLMDSFSAGNEGLQNVVYPRYSIQPIPAPDNCFWMIDYVEWKLYKFKIGSGS